jgi:pyrimidine operon attenuation protein / uracil phosphoribosyltransferase
MNTPLKARPASELDAESLYQELLQQMRVIVAKADSPVRLVGIASGGVWLAHRLQADLGLEGSAGVVSSSMHRDDFSTRGLSSMSVQTQLPFEINGANVWLIDDVLYTGRTIRAVLNELFDYGRPAAVKLAVLVDRGQRELPVEANLAIARSDLPATQLLELSRTEDGQLTFGIEATPE